MMKCTIQERLRLVGGAAEHGGLQPSIPTSSPRAQSRPRLFSIVQNTYSKLASIPHPQIKSYTMQKKPNIKALKGDPPAAALIKRLSPRHHNKAHFVLHTSSHIFTLLRIPLPGVILPHLAGRVYVHVVDITIFVQHVKHPPSSLSPTLEPDRADPVPPLAYSKRAQGRDLTRLVSSRPISYEA